MGFSYLACIIFVAFLKQQWTVFLTDLSRVRDGMSVSCQVYFLYVVVCYSLFGFAHAVMCLHIMVLVCYK
jgi:hypothetical protein